MFPIWDVDTSFGLWSTSWGEKPLEIWKTNGLMGKRLYFRYLLKSPLFRRVLKDEWMRISDNLYLVDNKMKTLLEQLDYLQNDNKNQWAPNASINDEIEYLMEVKEKRREWLNEFINTLP